MTAEQSNSVRQFRCPGCGGEMQLHNQRAQYVSCAYCGSVASADSEAHGILTRMENPAKYPSMSFIKLGMEGVFDGKKHHVIGRTRRKNTYKEYWEEGFESGYSDESWIFDEWLLISEDGAYFILLEDREGYRISRSVLPLYPTMPRGERVQDFFKEKERRVQEYGDTRILYFEGESTYIVKPGDKSSFSGYESEGKGYIAEWRYENGAIKEIEFFEEVSISAAELKRAFSLKEDTENTKTKSGSKRFKSRYILLFGGILNIIWGLLMMEKVTEADLLNMSISVKEEAQKHGWKTESDTLKSIIFQQTVSLNPSSKMLHIDLLCHLPDSSECFRELEFVDKKGNALFYDEAYSYRYTDNETFEAEQNEHLQNDFYMKDTTLTELDMRLTLKVPKTWNTAASSDISVSFRMTELDKVVRNRGMTNLWFGLALVVTGLLIVISKKK